MQRIAVVLILLLCAACAPAGPTVSTIDLPEGDAANGEALFSQTLNGLPECSSCHSLDGTRGTGPTLQGFGDVAGERRRGEDALTYTMHSIVSPNQYILPGFSGLMPPTYGQVLERQELADLIAFVLSQ
jgi:mono/diheme cytochrome c family protein